MTSTSGLLSQAATYALDRDAVTVADLQCALSVSPAAATAVMAELATWGIVADDPNRSGVNRLWRCRVRPDRRYRDAVLRALALYESRPIPEPSPLLHLRSDSDSRSHRLTQRQQRVLTLVALGSTNVDIGKVMAMTEDGVKGHLRVLYRMLGARDRAHAVHLAHLYGLLNSET